jgi:hypothetical protein
MSTQKEGPRSFAVWIGNLGDGEANAELSEELQKLGAALTDEAYRCNKVAKGKLTVTFTLQCDPRGVGNVAWDVNGKPPKKSRAAQAMWINKHGNWVHENPRQQSLPGIREVKQEPLEVRDLERTGDVREI